jgi:hypothetical protein
MADTTHRLNVSEASPELRQKLAALREKAIAMRHLDGPPVPPLLDDPLFFYSELRRAVFALKQARIAAGLTPAQVAEKCGQPEDAMAGLEAATLHNPTWVAGQCTKRASAEHQAACGR